MRTRLIILLLTLLVLFGLSGGYVVGGLQSYSRYQQSSFANQEHCGDQPPVHICVRVPAAIFSAYYPSYVASHLPLFIVEYSSVSPIALVVSMSIKGMSQVQVQNINATNNLQSVSILPPLIPQNLRKLTFEDHTSLRVQVTDNNKRLYYLDDIPLVLHSRWVMQWITANRLKLAAWVTPNDLAIGALVLKAASHLPLEPPPVPSAIAKRMPEKSVPRLTPFMMHCALIIKYVISRRAYRIAAQEMPVLQHKTSSYHQKYYSKAVGCALN